MTSNGHAPVTDLGAILAETKPARTVALPAAAIREDSLTPYELVAVGRALEMTPEELTREVRGGGWGRIELAQAFAWAILRRVEPDLTWAEAQTFRLVVGDSGPPATAAGPRRSRRRGTVGSSTSTG